MTSSSIFFYVEIIDSLISDSYNELVHVSLMLNFHSYINGVFLSLVTISFLKPFDINFTEKDL